MITKKQAKSFLKSLPRSTFFDHSTERDMIIGAIKGRLTCILLLDSDRFLNKHEIIFSEKIRRCGGDHFCIRSLEDLSELAKVRGWYDD